MVVKENGNAGLIFGLSAVAIVAAMGAGIDYARSAIQQGQLQSAADAAALAATNAANTGASASSATSLANQVFALNFSSSGGCAAAAAASTTPPSPPVPTVQISSGQGTVTTQVSYSTSLQTLFGQMVGLGCMTESATSTAQASTALPLFSEAGAVWGDPQIWGANGDEMMQLDCGANPSGWYVLLSDSQIEINGSCYAGFTSTDLGIAADPPWVGEYYLQGVTMMVGSHVVSFNTTLLPDTIANNPNRVFNGFGSILSEWDGSITIDGTNYPANLGGQVSYLGGMITGQPLTSTSNVTASGQCAQGSATNAICYEMSMDSALVGLNAPYFYTITLGAYQIQVYYRFDGGRLNIWASNAGACGTPGGAWGETLVGTYDANSADFLISGPTFEASQFSNTSCPTNSTARLIASSSGS